MMEHNCIRLVWDCHHKPSATTVTIPWHVPHALHNAEDLVPPKKCSHNAARWESTSTAKQRILPTCYSMYAPPPPCKSYTLVQATVGVGTVLIWYFI